MNKYKSIGALVRFDLKTKEDYFSQQHLLIGGVLKFLEYQIWGKTLYQIKKVDLSNKDGEINVCVEIFMEKFSNADDFDEDFEKYLDIFRALQFQPGYCPISTDFTWKWDKITRISDIGDGGMQMLTFHKVGE